MVILFLIIYLMIFIFLIFNFVRCLKNKFKWNKLLIFEIVFIVLTLILFIYYNNLPGFGFMPGFTYLGETLVNLASMILFIIIFLITLITKLIKYLVNKK
ncbi:MAG: hypothetical protein PUA90_04245 [bacterium]|nr:hypothetical protein [bacterium]